MTNAARVESEAMPFFGRPGGRFPVRAIPLAGGKPFFGTDFLAVWLVLWELDSWSSCV
jgi:hypothetical protein